MYLDQVTIDIIEWINENKNIEDYQTRESAYDEFYDELWVEDSVTGNASGSYSFNSYESKQHVMSNMNEVREALEEFCVPADEISKHFLNEDWEWFDVTTRCYVLSEALCKALDSFNLK